MAPSPEMQTFAGRLASFDGPKQLNKRRASSTKKKQPTASSWPHDHPNPEQLAKAGFFYKPSSSSDDSVTCYLCNKALDGWEAGDNPALEHLSHVPHCGWAINCCIEQHIEDMDRTEEDPLSEKMVEARRATFDEWWPHEAKRGWKCKTKKMVDAGWCYTPIPEADDCVTCFYCGASLEGWEPKDDPWQEHRKRAPDCHFFTLVEESAQLKKATKSKKGRTSRNSKASRQSAQSTAAGVDESAVQLDEDPVTEEGDSMLSNATTASKTSKPCKKSAKTKGVTRNRRNATLSITDTADDSADTEELEAEVERVLDGLEAIPEMASESPKDTRGRKPKRNTARKPSGDVQARIDATKPRPVRRKKGALSRPDIVTEAQQRPASPPDRSDEPLKKSQRGLRGRKRMSDGSEKGITDSVIVLESSPKSDNPERQGHKRSQESGPESAPHRSSESLHIATLSPGASEQVLHEENKQQQQQQQFSVDENERDGVDESIVLGDESAALQQPIMPEIYEDVLEDSAPLSPPQQPEEPRQQATPPPGDGDRRAPSRTPQSSNAENEPPSSKPPSSSRQPAILATSAQTPKTSPSKKHMVAGNQLPKDAWKSTDFETVFLPSPSYAHLGDKESFNIGTIVQNLTIAEKQLTVEEWIKQNAGQAEDRLRRECERMIGKFEDEGNRALNAMEGIECA